MEEKVLEFLKTKQKPFKSAEIAKELGLQTQEVTKIIKKLKEKKLVYSPKRCYYAVQN
ncbi:MAG: HTH domain-containing protein [Desulfonauticus sp.]|nr:HTH domain-containing protein [Desulfonauticus sp.]